MRAPTLAGRGEVGGSSCHWTSPWGLPCPDCVTATLTALAVARPARGHYLPDLHHLRLELEEAATPEGHAVRFGFNPLEFEGFSWRGYAQMTPIQVGAVLPDPSPAQSSRRGRQGGWQAGPQVTGLDWRRPGRGSPDLPRAPHPSPGSWHG